MIGVTLGHSVQGRVAMADKDTDPRTPLSALSGQRRLAAVLSADVVGYTRLMESDEEATHARLMRLRDLVLEPTLKRHGGRVVKNTGDGFLAMFDSAMAALEGAKEMQRAIMASELAASDKHRIAFRMGVNVADVIVEAHDIFGDGVNVAARLQSLAEPNGIVISGAVAEDLGGTFGMDAVDLGPMHVRNRAHQVRVVSLRFADAPSSAVGESEPGYASRPSIAVLPFRKLATVDDDYFADGIVDNIIHALAGLKELLVIARGSTLGFGAGAVDVQAIGSALGVRYVLYGSAQRSGKTLRIRTELIDTSSAEVIRSDQHDGGLSDLFTLQDRITEDIVKTIAPKVREQELKRALRKHPQNMTAYDLVLQALDLLNSLDYPRFALARGLLQRAMSIDPSYAPSFSYAAWWHSYRIGQEWSRDFPMDASEAIRLADTALKLDPSDALALAVNGHEQSYLRKNYVAALDCFDQALEACPNLAIAWTLKAVTLCFMGDGPGALDAANRGLRLSPVDQQVFFAEHILAQAHYINGDFDEAVAWSERAERHNARLTSNLRTLIASLVASGRVVEAREAARRHGVLSPHFSLAAWASRTPMVARVLQPRLEMLRKAGLPD
jgi:adenylate cyclase